MKAEVKNLFTEKTPDPKCPIGGLPNFYVTDHSSVYKCFSGNKKREKLPNHSNFNNKTREL